LFEESSVEEVEQFFRDNGVGKVALAEFPQSMAIFE